MLRFIPVICGILFFSACGPKMRARSLASYEMVTDYRLYTPCGPPVLNARLPAVAADAGDFYVYVLKDSLQIADCIDPAGAADAFPIRFRNDFILAVVVKNARKEWYFELGDMMLEDSLLHIKIVPRHVSDATQDKPWFPVSDNYLWRMNGRGVKLMKIYINQRDYAFVRGPRWSAAPLKWRLPRKGEDEL